MADREQPRILHAWGADTSAAVRSGTLIPPNFAFQA